MFQKHIFFVTLIVLFINLTRFAVYAMEACLGCRCSKDVECRKFDYHSKCTFHNNVFQCTCEYGYTNRNGRCEKLWNTKIVLVLFGIALIPLVIIPIIICSCKYCKKRYTSYSRDYEPILGNIQEDPPNIHFIDSYNSPPPSYDDIQNVEKLPSYSSLYEKKIKRHNEHPNGYGACNA